MKHFVLTRNSYPPDHPGLEERAHLLRSYVVPSLRNQTVRDFTWVLTSGQGLEGVDFSGLDAVVLDLPAPTDFNSTTYLMQQVVSELAVDLAAGERVITTRLDNDDMLLPRHVEDLHALATYADDPTLVDSPGYRVDTRFGAVYRDTHYADRRVPSPFVSLIENVVWKGARLRTAFYDQHTLMRRHFPLTMLPKPGWVQLIHGGNKVMSRSDADVASRGRLLEATPEDFLAAVLDGACPDRDGRFGS